MNSQQLKYLLENKEHVIDFWLSEFDTDPRFSMDSENTVSIDLLSHVFDEVIKSLEAENNAEILIESGLCQCGCEGTRGEFVRGEFYRSGKQAFGKVLNPEWDYNLPFNKEERTLTKNRVSQVLDQVAKTF
jgi:hypothetical protein